MAPVYSFSFYLQSRLEEMEDVDDAKDKLKLDRRILALIHLDVEADGILGALFGERDS